jgi:hypothetical protein
MLQGVFACRLSLADALGCLLRVRMQTTARRMRVHTLAGWLSQSALQARMHPYAWCMRVQACRTAESGRALSQSMC